MAEEGAGEKKHAPTERRLRQAAERGDVGRSQELPKAAAIAIFTLLGLTAAAGLGARLLDLFAAALDQAGTAPLSAASDWATSAAVALFPLLALLAAIALAGSIASGGWVFATNLLMPDFSKLMPQAGLGQIFSGHGFSEHGKSILKFLAIGGAGAIVILLSRGRFAALALLPFPVPGAMLGIALQTLGIICVVLVLLAAGDFALQFWMHRQKLRMSDEEIREEMKDAAGNPHVKSRQRAMARKLARARQMQRIPEASVVVTNPTHYACAIRYRRGGDRAPLLLAKGVGLLAEEIITRARAHGIPVVQSPPLARAIYRYVEPDDHVPTALYRACAEVLAYVWRLQRWRAQGGMKPLPPKPQEGEIEISRWVR
ncbi:flagellar biosynthesis protein FlhB [Acidocella sp.]|uniref:EscU/YscU/HrcU family type III secretion system export apparatus switch protein n=1 Tax=Acidocella sp. TaxID=50710 RepID=UPI00261EA4D8|nr:flagellar type III secretion system protein FlhB [Acidocella sp.]